MKNDILHPIETVSEYLLNELDKDIRKQKDYFILRKMIPSFLLLGTQQYEILITNLFQFPHIGESFPEVFASLRIILTKEQNFCQVVCDTKLQYIENKSV